MPHPKVTIEFCAKCKWHNRAVWYLLEIMQTFSDPDSNLVAEVALCPLYDKPGIFEVRVSAADSADKVIYRRRLKKSEAPQSEPFYYDGFPDSKLLKVLVRNTLFPAQGLGHVDGQSGTLNECVPCREYQ